MSLSSASIAILGVLGAVILLFLIGLCLIKFGGFLSNKGRESDHTIKSTKDINGIEVQRDVDSDPIKEEHGVINPLMVDSEREVDTSMVIEFDEAF